MKQLFSKFKNDQELYEEEFLDFYEGPEENARNWFNHYFEIFENNLSKLSIIDDRLVVWRMVNVQDVESINLNNTGGAWTYQKDMTHSWLEEMAILLL